MAENTFEKLNSIDLSEFVEAKGNFSYVSWSDCCEQFKTACPDATYEVKKNADGLPYFRDKDQIICMTSITVEGETLEMWLPCIDFKNNAKANPSMTDVNKTIMRCLVKNMAMFGLGAYIYRGEDLPDGVEDSSEDTISASSVKSLQNMAKAIYEKDKSFWPSLKAEYEINELKEIKKKDYNEISHRMNDKLVELNGGF